MTKVCIINIVLNEPIEKIINEDVAALTGDARGALDVALNVAKATKDLKDAKEKQKTDAEKHLNSAMDSAYQALAAAGPAGVPVADILKLVVDVIANGSAFTLRMKTILSTQGNPYRLDRDKRLGIQTYVFTPFNQAGPPSP